MRSRQQSEIVDHRGRTFTVCLKRGQVTHAATVECNGVLRTFPVRCKFGPSARVAAIEKFLGMEACGR